MNEQTNEKCGFYNTVVAWACIIWAVASIGLMINTITNKGKRYLWKF